MNIKIVIKFRDARSTEGMKEVSREGIARKYEDSDRVERCVV